MAESSTDAATPTPSLEETIENAKRAFALNRYEQAVEFYASALEIATLKFGDNAVENADIYFAYGQALLENAISQSSVLGKDQGDDKEQDEPQASTSSTSGPILEFSGDAEEEAPDGTVDLFGNAEKAIAEAEAADIQEGEDDEGEDEGGEPEDDFNEAWDIFEIARNLYEKQAETQKDVKTKLKLAETYIALGDVSLETEKFDQAILDYQEGLRLKNELLPVSSRQIAEGHYKLCIVLDLTSGRLAEAITHSEAALNSVDTRLGELQARVQPLEAGSSAASGSEDSVDSVNKLSASQVEVELKELNGLRNDLALKVEELKTSPNDAPEGASAPELVAAALDRELNGARNGTSTGPIVNDLTSIIKKKKKKPTEETVVTTEPTTGKRKAEEISSEDASSEKKMRLSP